MHSTQSRQGYLSDLAKSRSPLRLMMKERDVSGLYPTLFAPSECKKMIFWLMTKESNVCGLYPTLRHYLNVLDFLLTFKSPMFLVNISID